MELGLGKRRDESHMPSVLDYIFQNEFPNFNGFLFLLPDTVFFPTFIFFRLSWYRASAHYQ